MESVRLSTNLKLFLICFFQCDIQFQNIHILRTEKAEKRFLYCIIYESLYLCLVHATCLGHAFHLYISTGGSDIRIKTGSTGGYHFCRNVFTVQIRMVYEESSDTGFYFRKIFFVGRAFVATGRTGSIVTVTGMGRTAPEINILRELLPDIGGAYPAPVQNQGFRISSARAGSQSEYPQH